MENKKIKKVIFLANRLNKGPIGGPAGVLYLQEHILGKNFFEVPSEFHYNEKETKDLLLSATRLADKCKKDVNSAYFIVNDVETAYALSLLGADYSLIFHQQGSVIDEILGFGVKLPPAEVNRRKKIEKTAFCCARSVHFPSHGAEETFFSSSNTLVKKNWVSLGRPLYNTIVKPQKTDNRLPEKCEDFLTKEKGIVFLSVGTVTFAKGQDQAIEFLKKVCKETDKNIKYIVVGDGIGTVKLDERASQLQAEFSNFYYLHIKKTEHDKILNLFEKVDYYIMLHRISIFDLATLEAMRAGCAVILSRVGGNSDFNKLNNILFYEQSDIKELLNVDRINHYKVLNKQVFYDYFSETQFRKLYRDLWNTLSKDVPSVKILVCYHKKYKTLQNRVYKPIIVGNALKEKTIIHNALKDDDGVNISELNPYFCELTAQYWAWKNDEKLNDPDYVGFMHYRRYLWFGQKIDKLKDYINERSAQKACADQADIILPTPQDIYSRTKNKICVNFAEQYSIEQHVEDLEKIRMLIEKMYPQYYSSFIKTAYSLKKISWCNVFIAKKEISEEYSRFLFTVLFEAEKIIPYSSYKTAEERRVFGFISELLLNTYVDYKQRENKNFKIMYYDLVNIEKNNKTKSTSVKTRELFNKLIKKIVYFFVPEKTIKNYIHKAAPHSPSVAKTNYNDIIKINNYETYRTIWYANKCSKEVIDQLSVLSRSSFQWTVNHSELWQMFMSMLLETGQTEEFERIFLTYISSAHKYNGFEKFLKLSNYLYKKDNSIAEKNKKIAIASNIYDKMLENRNVFAELVGGKKTVAIVGNAGTELGKKKGSEIDNHDIVIRFNNYPLRNYESDYGKKTDIWVRGSGAKDVEDRALNNRYQCVMWEADYDHYKVFYDHLDIMSRMLLEKNEKTSFFSGETHDELRHLSKTDFPTSGAVAIYATYLAKDKSFNDIDLYGFSFLNENASPGHFYDTKSKMNEDHQMDAEKAFLKSFYSKNKV